MSRIIDFHTHAFPDKVAATAIPALEDIGKVKASHDGRISSLLASMDKAAIDASVLCCIATKIEQGASILSWSKAIRSERIIPFPSFHPDDSEALARIEEIKAAGFSGIKMHPYYQKFVLDEERMLPLYEKIMEQNLILVMHTGFDIGFPRERIADPKRIAAVIERFPNLKLVATHMGAWDQWDEVESTLAGRSLYMDISFSLHQLSVDDARRLLLKHPADKILFGTDSPWANQKEVIGQLQALALEPELNEAILHRNAEQLLASVSQ